MNTLNANKSDDTRVGVIGKLEKIVRTVVGFSGLLAVLTGVVSNPLQYFVLIALGVYLIHTVIIGLDPFYAIAHYLRVALVSQFAGSANTSENTRQSVTQHNPHETQWNI
jgi:hypothetical protein